MSELNQRTKANLEVALEIVCAARNRTAVTMKSANTLLNN
jgi:hypothetical protein